MGDRLYIGIDLGTFQSTIATSKGEIHTIETVVGTPKDPVARNMLGRDTLFGADALPHTLPQCPLCQQPDIAVLHPLCGCSATVGLFDTLQQQLPTTIFTRSNVQALVLTLFGPQVDRAALCHCIGFVGRAVCACLAQPRLAHPTPDVFSVERLAALARHRKRREPALRRKCAARAPLRRRCPRQPRCASTQPYMAAQTQPSSI